MIKAVHWVEPIDEICTPAYYYARPETVIKMWRSGFQDGRYDNVDDETVLDDFMVVHWAVFVDVDESQLTERNELLPDGPD